MHPVERELAALKFIDGLSAHLRDVREPHKALRHALRDTREYFQAAHGCIATLRAGRSEANLLFTLPKQTDWDLSVLTRYIRHTYPPVERAMLIGSVKRRGGAGCDRAGSSRSRLRSRGSAADRAHRRGAVGGVHRIDRDRMLDVRDRIDRKIMEQIHPKDLFYQILDGLRSLTHYDHSSALLIREDGEGVAARGGRADRVDEGEQPADRPAASDHGRCRGLCNRRRSTASIGTARRGGLERPAGDRVGDAARLQHRRRRGRAEVREASMLCAPLVTRDGLVGMLKIAARHPGQLKPFDAELVEHFRSQAAIAIQNLHRTESLRARVLTAERKHAMADLARSVSHDVNNALGSMLPLVQQMQADLARRARGPRCFPRTSSRCRSRCRSAGGSSAGCCPSRAARRGAAGTDRCGRAHRNGVGDPEVRHGPQRHRAVSRRPRRPSAGGLQPERSRAGVPQPAHQRARGDAERRTHHGRRPADGGAVDISIADTGCGIRPRTCRACSSRSSRPNRTATASACQSAARSCGRLAAHWIQSEPGAGTRVESPCRRRGAVARDSRRETRPDSGRGR